MLKIITIPFDRKLKGFDDEILNRFVQNKHVKSVKSQFFSDGGEHYWTVFIECETVLDPVRKKNEPALDDTQGVLFENLRKWRKERADKDGVPVYVIGSNKEFEEIARLAPKSLEALKGVKGFGTGKIEKYGKEIIGVIQAFYEVP